MASSRIRESRIQSRNSFPGHATTEIGKAIHEAAELLRDAKKVESDPVLSRDRESMHYASKWRDEATHAFLDIADRMLERDMPRSESIATEIATRQAQRIIRNLGIRSEDVKQ
jgi:hypothetical protein